MPTLARSVALGTGLLIGLATAAGAQTYYYPQYTSNSYIYPYSYSGNAYTYPYNYYGYSYAPGYTYYGYPYYQRSSNFGTLYPAPLAFWDPYVGWRPYSDNAGPKASGH